MKLRSIWKNIEYKNLKPLKKDEEVDVLIIGGGLTGISCAYNLINSNLKICVVEQGKVGSQTSANTTAKINYLQETIYSYLTNKYSFKVASKYLKSQLDGISFILNTINKNNIDCNLEKVSSYVFTNKNCDIDKLKREKFILNKMNIKVKEHTNIPVKVKCKYAISVDNTYTFHPLKYLYTLTDICLNNNIDIYEHTRILEIKKDSNKYLCITENNKISAKKVILACHYPFFLFPMFMPIKTYIEKSYLSASITDTYKDNTYITPSNPCKSIRYYEDNKKYIIYLCNSHNICNKLDEKSNYKKLIKKTKKLGVEPNYIWSNDDLITLDKMPYIGSIKENLYICTGYNTWGMTNASVAAIIIKDLILGNNNEYIDLFNPKRANKIRNIGGYIVNISSNTKSYIQNKLIKNKNWYSSNIKFKNINSEAVAVYKNKYIVKNKCPHMGCSLIFNEIEKTWDCPCHASKFDLKGNVIKGPSKYDIKYH